ncbi:MAG: LytR/AlgR family response regulator transcription factor [Candidatus Methylacidiphilales bacterium]|nr:LytTR family DNA-binding domain-containing protein [Candidatus Methylacidiphilales bacterium]
MRALIVDDERHARLEMKRLLRAHPEVEVVGEAESIDEALQMILEHDPDLLFLDVQLRSDTGFDLLARLTPPLPKIIFTTAYDAYALRAFQVNALDYLLKPVEPSRLSEALQRVGRMELRPQGEADAASEDNGPATVLPGSGKFTESDRVFIREEERCWFLPIRDIRLLESEGNYTRIYCPEARPLIYRSLNSLEIRLPESLFFRANRSQLINLTCIESIENWFSGNLKVRMRGGMDVEISRRQAVAFRERSSL